MKADGVSLAVSGLYTPRFTKHADGMKSLWEQRTKVDRELWETPILPRIVSWILMLAVGIRRRWGKCWHLCSQLGLPARPTAKRIRVGNVG